MKRPELEILEKNIRAALERVGLNRANAADQLGVDRSWFYRMMANGNWKMEVLVALSDLLGVPMWRLFFDETDVKDVAKDILVSPGGERPALVNLDDYVDIPIVKFQVELDSAGSGPPHESLGTMFVKKDLIGTYSAGKSPYAIEMKVKVTG
jgi:hypothetical protein